MTALLVLLGAAVGAPLRYLVGVALNGRGSGLPWGTFAVNVTGSALLGLVAALGESHDGPGWLMTLVGVGFCGAVTTFSTWSVETMALLEEDRVGAALLNVLGSLATGLAAFAGAWWLVSTG